MAWRASHARCFSAVSCAMLLLSLPAFAKRAGDISEFGRDITVEQGDTVADVACIGCSVHIRGTATGDVIAVAGRVDVEGSVRGDVAAILGEVRVESGASIGGDVAAIGGRVRQQPGASVRGDVAAFPLFWILLPAVFVVGLIVVGIVFLIHLLTRERSHVPVRP